MEASLVDYFELNEAKQDGQDAPLSEENFPPAEPDRADDVTPLADDVTAEDDLPIENKAEISGLQEQSDLYSVAEGSDPYAAPEQAVPSGADVEEKPPEEVKHDTE